MFLDRFGWFWMSRSKPAALADREVDLTIEVVADGGRVVGRSIWPLEAPVRPGEPLAVDWSLDENQCLTLRLRRIETEAGEDEFEQRYDAPLTHIDQGQVARCGLLETEELTRCNEIPKHHKAIDQTRVNPILNPHQPTTQSMDNGSVHRRICPRSSVPWLHLPSGAQAQDSRSFRRHPWANGARTI